MTLTRRQFLLTGAAAGAAAAGAVAWPQRHHVRKQIKRWLHPALRLGSPADLNAHFDVCIFGSGPAGATLGLELARRGLHTLLLESGLAAGETDRRLAGLEQYSVVGDVPYPLAATRFRGIGGTSVLWTGRCSRLHPSDFARNPYTPDGGDWPITYDELEPYYVRADRTLGVAGVSGARHRAPRSSDYPIELTWGGSGTKQRMRSIDVEFDHSPSSHSPIGSGPVRAATDLLPLFTADRHATLVSGLTATRLETSANGTVIRAHVSDLAGRSYVALADRYVVACGAVESARLLLLSESSQFPRGLGNAGDCVGRFFMEHPGITIQARVPRPDPHEGILRSHQHYDRFKRDGLGAIILHAQSRPQGELRLGATWEMRPRAENRISLSATAKDPFGAPSAQLSLYVSEDDRRTLDRIKGLLTEMLDELDAEQPRHESSAWSHHHMGTCRMGADPETSVTDADLRVHGTSNLFVLGSGAFVTSGASHPTLTIVALAHRLADHMKKA